MTYLTLESCAGGKIVVFAHNIAWMDPNHSGGTLIWFGGHYVAVKESIEQIIALIAAHE